MKNKLFIALVSFLLLVSIGFVVFALVSNTGETDEPTEMISENPVVPEHKVVVKEVEKLVEVEKEITAETIKDGLNNMGFLITQEYYFTQVVSYSSVKKLLDTDIKLPFTESSYLASYDGVVTAGVDFSKISVTKNESEKSVLISLPDAEIKNVDIDPNSFVLYSEKEGLGNPVSVADFNNSLIELEKNAKKNAVEKGLLTNAENHAKEIVSEFVRGVVGPEEYTVRFD